MKKIYFCKENDDFKTKKVYKSLKSLYPDIIIKRRGCVGKCKTCKKRPFSLVDNKVVASKSAKKLHQKIDKQLKKLDIK